MKKAIMLTVVALLIIASSSAIVYEQNEIADIKYVNPAETDCNITILSPSGVVLTDNLLMENQGIYFNYTLQNTESVGNYDVYFICSNFTSAIFRITSMGLESPADYAMIFMYLAVLVELVAGLYLLFYTLQHTFVKETDLKILGMNYVAWFSLYIILGLNQNYIGSAFSQDMLELLIKLGVFTNMIIPTIGFVWSFIMNRFKDMRNAMKGGKNEW